MLPFRTRDCIQYDPAQRQLHARDWAGGVVTFDTPAELIQALAADRLYAVEAVHAAALWFAADHGVQWELPAQIPEPVRLLASRGASEGFSPSTLQRCLQALDRGYDRSARFAMELLTDDDVACIVDRDGVAAQVLMHVVQQSQPEQSSQLVWIRTALIPDATTVVLIHTGIERMGFPCDAADLPALRVAQHRGLARYAITPFGPRTAAAASSDTTVNAVVTARGMYRPDRVQRYDDDADIGPDIISLT
jgi:hypothetical protein